MEEYIELKKQLEALEEGWDNNPKNNQRLDASYIAVSITNDWRKAKRLGCKKDYYYGWVLFSTSTNSDGYSLYEETKKLTEGFEDIRVCERQL